MSLLDAPALAYAEAENPWFSWQFVRQNTETLVAALREHALLTGETVLIALIVAVPLAVLAYWFRPLTGPILAFTGVLYTIPSLALFALLAPFVGVGRVTVLIGLVLYALLVLVRNIIAGLVQVPEDVLDAARGMGYGRFAQLWRGGVPPAPPRIPTRLRPATLFPVA